MLKAASRKPIYAQLQSAEVKVWQGKMQGKPQCFLKSSENEEKYIKIMANIK